MMFDVFSLLAHLLVQAQARQPVLCGMSSSSRGGAGHVTGARLQSSDPGEQTANNDKLFQ